RPLGLPAPALALTSSCLGATRQRSTHAGCRTAPVSRSCIGAIAYPRLAQLPPRRGYVSFRELAMRFRNETPGRSETNPLTSGPERLPSAKQPHPQQSVTFSRVSPGVASARPTQRTFLVEVP